MAEVMRRFGVVNRYQVKAWCSRYRKLGDKAFAEDERAPLG